MGHVLMENRHGLVVDGDLTEASGTAERDTAVDMDWPNARADSGLRSVATSFTTPKALLRNFCQLRATPHVAQNDTNRRSAIDARTTRHSGYDVSQRVRKRIEEIFGWGKDGTDTKNQISGQGPSWLSTV